MQVRFLVPNWRGSLAEGSLLSSLGDPAIDGNLGAKHKQKEKDKKDKKVERIGAEAPQT